MRFVSGGASAGGSTSALTVALASVLVAAGCTGDPGPIVTHTPSDAPTAVVTASPSPTPSPSATPLTDAELFALMPEGADREDLLGAMITAQFFLEQYGPMFHTGDTRIWEALSTPECGYCADAIMNAERVRDEGWTAEGGDITVDTSKTQASLTTVAQATAVFAATVADAFLLDAEGVRQQTGSARTVAYELTLERVDATWKVVAGSSQS